MKKKITFFIALTLTAGLLFSGCKKDEESDKQQDTKADVTAEETPAETPENTPAEELTGPPTEPGQSYDNPEITFAPNEDAVGEEITAVEPGTKVVPAANSTEAADNTIVLKQNGRDMYRLTINKMELTDERNPDEAPADQVMIVTFTYENYGLGSSLFIDRSRFHMADKDGLACSVYTLNSIDSENMPAEIGASCTASIAFSIPGRNADVTLYYTDFDLGENAEYSFKAENIKE